MMTVTVELLHGTIRAGSADGLAVAGEDDPGEWPPSPARLLSAFTAADGTRDRCRMTSGAELRSIEVAPPPRILADHARTLTTSPSQPRFVVVDRREGGAVKDYPARSSAEVRPARRAGPRNRHVCYVWPELNPSAGDLDALRRRAARIGYFGCADSPVRVSVATEVPASVAELPIWAPTAERGHGHVSLPVPFDGLIAALDTAYDQWVAGVPTQRSWVPSIRQRYTDHADVPRPYLVWLRLVRPVTGRRVLALTSALREAVMSRYGDATDSDPDDLPSVLHGHGFTGPGYRHAQWLALPDVGHPHARGRIHGLAILLPPDTVPDVVDGVHGAASAVAASGLRLPGGSLVDVVVSDGREGPFAAQAHRWSGPAHTWVTAFPAVHERWGKGRDLSLEEVTRWCEHAGLPAPVSFEAARVPLVAGASTLLPAEVHRPAGERRPYSHLRVRFADQVEGPVVLGRARHFGLGLMLPEHPRTRA